MKLYKFKVYDMEFCIPLHANEILKVEKNGYAVGKIIPPTKSGRTIETLYSHEFVKVKNDEGKEGYWVYTFSFQNGHKVMNIEPMKSLFGSIIDV